MQAWYLVESKIGYWYNLDIYEGKQADDVDRNLDKVHSIIMCMVEPCNVVGHCLYFDNYYTSTAVLEALSVKKFGACGTLWTNRKGVPDEIKRAKLKVGMTSSFYCNDDILFIVWFDKKQVNLATNLYNERMFEKQLCARTDDQHVELCKSQWPSSYTHALWMVLIVPLKRSGTWCPVTDLSVGGRKSSSTFLSWPWWTLT